MREVTVQLHNEAREEVTVQQMAVIRLWRGNNTVDGSNETML